MSCWCGHGPWHRWGPRHWYGFGPYGPGAGYGPEYAPAGRWPRRRRARVEDLEEYLHDLEEEVAEVRAELEELRGRSAGQ